MITVARVRVLTHQFQSRECPICQTPKPPRNCFCKSCYFALKTARPTLAAGLYATGRGFYENYSRAKTWLTSTGLRKSKAEEGGLFA